MTGAVADATTVAGAETIAGLIRSLSKSKYLFQVGPLQALLNFQKTIQIKII